jgi:hypothetical protein
MKNILMTLAFLGAAAYGIAAPPAPAADDRDRDRDRDRDTAAAADDAERPNENLKVKPKTEDVAGLSKFIENVEVVSSDPVAKQMTFKIAGEEETMTLPNKLSATLKVVRPGDKVRVYYEASDETGRPRTVQSVVITKPNLEGDREALQSAADGGSQRKESPRK